MMVLRSEDAILSFQDGADLEPTTSFLDNMHRLRNKSQNPQRLDKGVLPSPSSTQLTKLI